ncbi:ladderlectin-like, partial [Plectropomus leopardus]|uniref:ladderlectin-like n=1 Tax=Plectropomus leopardus TaxID=160734 RepID=UPI001C4C1F01
HQRHCTAIGGSLTSIHGKKEYQEIRALIKDLTNTHKKTWVGGYDAAQDGVWLWSDNTVFDFKGWGNGEPNGGGREHCMEINFRGKNRSADDVA